MTFRISCFIILLLATLFSPIWLFALLAVSYVFVYNAPYEVLILSVCIDAIFGNPNSGMWFTYSLIVSVAIIVTSVIKPYIRFYS